MSLSLPSPGRASNGQCLLKKKKKSDPLKETQYSKCDLVGGASISFVSVIVRSGERYNSSSVA